MILLLAKGTIGQHINFVYPSFSQNSKSSITKKAGFPRMQFATGKTFIIPAFILIWFIEFVFGGQWVSIVSIKVGNETMCQVINTEFTQWPIIDINTAVYLFPKNCHLIFQCWGKTVTSSFNPNCSSFLLEYQENFRVIS